MRLHSLTFTVLFLSVNGDQASRSYNNDLQHRYRDEKMSGSAEKNYDIRDEDHQIVSNRGSATFNFEDYGDYEYHEGSLGETIPGKAGKDFPAYTSIPKTGFSCKGRTPGYFADAETNCQVFHVCVEGGQKISFLCPNGSIFNQKVSVCDWWYDVDCITSPDLIDSNDIQRNPSYTQPNNNDYYTSQKQPNSNDYYIVESEPYYDLTLASSGGNQNPKYENEAKKAKTEQEKETNKNASQDGRRKQGKNKITKNSQGDDKNILNSNN